MDSALAATIATALGAAVKRATRVHGGDVSEAYRVELGDGRTVFAKTHRRPPPGFFTTEAAGLRWLRAARALAVPEVLAVGDGDATCANAPAHLVLERIDEGRPGPTTEADLGEALAGLHAAGAPSFGREDRRTTGSLRLPNDPCATWTEFYAERRLRPLAQRAAERRALAAPAIAGLERVAGRLGTFAAADEAPARLHGDLWAGNRLVDGRGRNWLIDPAAHGGHREYDLAMMRLFGGFGPAAFRRYADVAPLADGWEDRVVLHQLAPLVVHAIKFGGGYVPAAEAAVARYA